MMSSWRDDVPDIFSQLHTHPHSQYAENDAEGKGPTADSLQYGPRETLGYASHRIVPTFSVCRRVMDQLQVQFFQIRSRF